MRRPTQGRKSEALFEDSRKDKIPTVTEVSFDIVATPVPIESYATFLDKKLLPTRNLVIYWVHNACLKYSSGTLSADPG